MIWIPSPHSFIKILPTAPAYSPSTFLPRLSGSYIFPKLSTPWKGDPMITMEAGESIREGEGLAPLSGEEPAAAFVDFHRRSRRGMGKILRDLQTGEAGGRGFTLRAGLMDPLHSVISERVKEFCRLPYRTGEGMIASCPGILDDWKACPPHSPAVEETIGVLSGAAGFLIVQFEGDEDLTEQKDAHLLTERAAGDLAGAGFAVQRIYACGPCRVCRRGCGEGDKCRQPARRIFALESCGFWINALCRRAGDFPVFGGGPEEVRWIRNWGLPDQDTTAVRYVTGVLLG